MLYVPTPAPYGGTVRAYVYVPLGDSAICTGYHLGVPLETRSTDSLARDIDAKPRRACVGSPTDDFDGTALNCAVGEPGIGSGDNCYDIKI
jgi:hypothetical protein